MVFVMNPKDIAGKKFEKGGMFGYKPEEVDEYLKDIAYEFAQLAKEKAELERKLEILAEKVREYRSDEDMLKEALLGAQRQGRETIAEARREAEQVLADAKVKADAVVGDTRVQIEKEKSQLKRMQKEVSDFKAKLLSLYKSHLDMITALPDVEEEKRPVREASKLTFTEEPEASASVQPPVAEPEPEAPAEAKGPEAHETAERSSALPMFGGDKDSYRPKEGRFGELKFGARER